TTMRKGVLLAILLLSCQGIYANDIHTWHHLVKRRTGDKPPVGKCMNCRWGGKTGLHFYTCCNNCDEPESKCKKDQIVYDGASRGKYCGPCGEDTAAGNATICNKEASKTYKCGGCDGQLKVKSKCDDIWLFQIPGLCWAWQICFNKLCKEVDGKINVNELYDIPDTFCGDSVCQSSETYESCPIDCCWKKNPKCLWEHDGWENCSSDEPCSKCPQRCCNEPTCCDISVTGDPHVLQPDKDLDIPLCYNLYRPQGEVMILFSHITKGESEIKVNVKFGDGTKWLKEVVVFIGDDNVYVKHNFIDINNGTYSCGWDDGSYRMSTGHIKVYEGGIKIKPYADDSGVEHIDVKRGKHGVNVNVVYDLHEKYGGFLGLIDSLVIGSDGGNTLELVTGDTIHARHTVQNSGIHCLHLNEPTSLLPNGSLNSVVIPCLFCAAPAN
ncbi:unnamed protein product, partial [Owenia fusiformis]